MIRSPAETRDRWLNYGRRYAVHPTLHDGSVACMLGPLAPEAGTLHDYSERTIGAAWSVGAGDVPKYVQGSVRGQSFWASRHDGADDVASVGSTPAVNVLSAMSVAAWFRKDAPPVDGNEGLFAKWIGNPIASRQWQIVLQRTTGYAICAVSESGAYEPANEVSGSVNLCDSRWHSVAMAFCPAARISLYVDGVLVAEKTSSIASSIFNSSVPVQIGSQFVDPPSANSVLLGESSSCAIWSRVLTPAEIAVLATHPLAAYEVRVPKYWSFAPPSGGTHLWPWQIRRSRRLRGKR